MKIKRAATLGAILVAPLVLYLVLANVLLSTPLLTSLTNRKPEKFLMSYDSAYTLWPGRVHVRGYRMSFQAYKVAFELEIDESTATVVLSDLLKRQFHAKNVVARGVAWRQLVKGDPATINDPRVRAFPVIAGRPPVTDGPPPAPRDPSTIHKLWSVRLDGVDSTVRELWILEYRWQGRGTARGSFEVLPLRSFWVKPARAELQPGTLSVGGEIISKNFSGEADTVIEPTAIEMKEKIKMLRTLNVDGDFEMDIDSLKFAKAYGLDASGSGRLELHADVRDGAVGPDMKVTLELPEVNARAVKNGAGFEGAATAVLWEEQKPRVHLEAAGDVSVPLPGGEVMVAGVPKTEGDLALTTSDFVELPKLEWFDVKAGSLVAKDTLPLRNAMKGKVPFIVPALLGRGPLTAQGLQARGSPKRMRVRIGDARMGETRMRGQLDVKPGSRPDGAFEATVATMPMGISVKQGKPSFQFLTKPGWLEDHLAAEAKNAERGEAPRSYGAK